MKFRTKLILFFVLLISLPSVINGYINYNASSDIIVRNARDSIQEIVKKNNEIGDIVYKNIEERTVALISDPDLFRLFDRPQPANDYELVKMDRQATAILYKYFGHSQDFYTVQLMTSYYSFGSGTHTYTTNSPFVSVSPEGFQKSYIYEQVKERQGSIVWVPTYDLTRVYNQEQLFGMDQKFKMVFSSARMINSSPIIDGVSHSWPESVERPVLLINFNEEFYRNTVEQRLPVPDSYFYIVSRDGQIVTHPDISKLGTIDENEWYLHEFKASSGTSLVKEDGEDVLIAYDTSKVTDWITVSVIPYNQLLRNLPTVRYMDLLIALALIVMAIVIASFIAGRLTNPIKKMLVAIQLTGSGDFSTKIPDQSQLEFRILIKKFNHMNEKIQELIKENYESTLREKEAEIMALNLQLNPHFLYNTLNIINWMAIDRDDRAISKMIVSLSTMLQYTVNNKQEIVKLKDDLEWLRSYTHIMENRFEGVFKVEYELDQLPGDCKVPKLFLQPIVENAIIHGFEALEKGGVIRISGQVRGEMLFFEVSDNGKGMSAQHVQTLLNPEAKGIGVKNIAQRISLIYGERSQLHIHSEIGKGTVVAVTIPLQK
ncbi:sensor histidine kinase [Paenibacillus sp. LHD-38]|uniref:sensor histidine kinase n=1 Tax=Paenibacillus sp. LHD-38 TaxID=3072143 RepID=UPI0028106297|nr:sensor histidine kinase [Paenibacillus sp. LHD-38]MDQ8737709.1 sensor histidine kinase [Paenibacillus sp. LHD-38]